MEKFVRKYHGEYHGDTTECVKLRGGFAELFPLDVLAPDC